MARRRSLCERALNKMGPAGKAKAVSRYWILLYEPIGDRQMRVFRDATSLAEAIRAAEAGNPGHAHIAAGLQRELPR